MNIAICDDERVFREKIVDYLKPYLADHSDITECEFCCGEDLVAEYEQGTRFDLIFLDVEMSHMNGIDAAQKIRVLDDNVMFIFVTSHTSYVSEAFLVNAIQFLIKPINQDVFNREFSRAICIYKKRKFKYKIMHNDSLEYVEIQNLMYIETFGRHLKAVTSEKVYEYVGNISAEEKKLMDYGFVRCHKAFLLNMYYIYKPEKDTFILSNGKNVPIGRGYKIEALSQFNKYISKFCL